MELHIIDYIVTVDTAVPLPAGPVNGYATRFNVLYGTNKWLLNGIYTPSGIYTSASEHDNHYKIVTAIVSQGERLPNPNDFLCGKYFILTTRFTVAAGDPDAHYLTVGKTYDPGHYVACVLGSGNNWDQARVLTDAEYSNLLHYARGARFSPDRFTGSTIFNKNIPDIGQTSGYGFDHRDPDDKLGSKPTWAPDYITGIFYTRDPNGSHAFHQRLHIYYDHSLVSSAFKIKEGYFNGETFDMDKTGTGTDAYYISEGEIPGLPTFPNPDALNPLWTVNFETQEGWFGFTGRRPGFDDE